MKNTIQILHVEQRSGRSKRGNDYDMRIAQCIVERVDADGVAAPLVGILMLPEKFKNTVPGRYEVTFELAIGQELRIGAVVADMKAIPREARPASAPPAAPAAAAKG